MPGDLLGASIQYAALARAIVLVEGVSDVGAVDALARRRCRDLAAESVAVIAIGGSKNIDRALALLGDTTARLAGLCDEREEPDYRFGLERAGFGVVATRDALESLGFFVCEPDLEGELIAALGVEAVERVLEERNELSAFRTFQRQPAWRGREAAEQLRRFLGTHSGRKIGAAPALVAALDLASVPRPLDGVLASV